MKVGLLSLRVVQVVRQQQCSGHCLCDSAQAQQLKQQMRSAQVAGQWRGYTALTVPLFWRRSTVSPVSFGRYPRSRSSLHSFIPPTPSRPPSLISYFAFVDVKQNGPARHRSVEWILFVGFPCFFWEYPHWLRTVFVTLICLCVLPSSELLVN